MQKKQKKGASRVSEVDEDVLDSLEKGILETKTLSEMLAINLDILLRNTFPELPKESIALIENIKAEGILKRMGACADVLTDFWKKDISEGIAKCASHSSDMVRGFGCFIIGNRKNSFLEQDISDIRTLADDNHFGVREWAWLGVRNKIIIEPENAIKILTPWVYDKSEYIRRFASEATRPRGVWCSHISLLKQEPEKALCLLEPLNADISKYVRDSVANWLNDASKTQPQWVKSICDQWQILHPTKETISLCKRALRTISKNTIINK